MFKFLLICAVLIASSPLGYCRTNSILIARFYEYDIVEKPTDHAKVARELVHKSQWTPMSTISTLKSMEGDPMVNTIAIADGPAGGESTGNIYFYLTNLDFTGQDVKKNNVATLLFSNDTDLSCTKESIDTMEPTCARAVISGRVVELEENTDEYIYAKKSFISRHPAAPHWIQTHRFFLCKLNIERVIVLDWYGGPHFVDPVDYYKVIL